MDKRKRSIIWSVSKEELQKLLDSKDSYSDVMRHFGLNPNNGSVKTLYKRIKDENLDVSNIRKNRWACGKKRRQKDEYIFCENSTFSRTAMKNRIIFDKLIDYKCSSCGNEGEWRGERLSLQLEHINGISNDNRLKNLTFLCPNCHSQTKTYAGRKNKIFREKKDPKWREKPRPEIRKVKRPSKEVLEKLVLDEPMTKIGTQFGVSDNAVRRWCKSYRIILPKRLGYWAKIRSKK